MKQLAFVGHSKRGKEIKEILQQLGGTHVGYACSGERFYFYINRSNTIEGSSQLPSYDVWKIYTLEEFEKEFPYKVGDVVTYFDRNNKTIHLLIQNIRWNPIKHGGTLEYVLQNGIVTTVENLRPMKKELKDYLKPGYVVEYDDGVRCVLTQDVHGNVFGVEIHHDQHWAMLKDLSHIVAVYQITSPSNLHCKGLFESSTKKVWERKEVELTMQEIADKFGIDVNQLKIKK